MTRIPLTVRHVYDFGEERGVVGDDLVRPEAWDALRTRTSGAFALPADRPTWERQAEARADIVARAEAIDAWATEAGVGTLASYGVGGASLEYLLWRRRPERPLVLSDYAPETVERLRGIFEEVEIRQFDLLADPPLPADAHLFHRIDTEFTNRQLRAVMRRFADRRVLLVATEVIDLRRASWEVRIRLRNPNVSKAGWIRTRGAFERLWARTHTATPLRFHDLDAWDLRPKR